MLKPHFTNLAVSEDQKKSHRFQAGGERYGPPPERPRLHLQTTAGAARSEHPCRERTGFCPGGASRISEAHSWESL